MQRTVIRRLGIGIVGVLSLLVVAQVGRRIILPLPMDRCRSSQFDAALWRDSMRTLSAEAVRGCMVDNLLKEQQLRGMSGDSLVALLGPASGAGYFKEYDLVYWLGPERSLMSVDSEWLVVRLDRAGRVTEARRVTD